MARGAWRAIVHGVTKSLDMTERLTPSLALLPASSLRFAHGGSLAALIDETFSKTAYLSGEGLLTLNFNIRFKK